MHVDRGCTHVALPVRDLDASIEFYARFADMHVVHRRDDGGVGVAWITDGTRPFVVVLIESPAPDAGLGGTYCHLGVAVATREEVDDRCARARAGGHRVVGPEDAGPPVGYWAYVVDPDGHNLELSYGQEVAFTVETGETVETGDTGERD